MTRPPALPITLTLPDILARLQIIPQMVLEAPRTAGKATQVPLMLLQAPWIQGRILMLEPRRVAARSGAMFTAAQSDQEIGELDELPARLPR